MADDDIRRTLRIEYGIPPEARTEYALNAEARQRRNNLALRALLQRAAEVTRDGPDHRD